MPDQAHERGVAGPTAVDVRERGAGQQTSTRRLYLQLHAFGACRDEKALIGAIESSGAEAVVYADVNDPSGVGVLALAEDPAFFVGRWRALLASGAFAALTRKPELTMFGRTYATGFEANLDEWLLERPRRTALHPEWPWAVWYPLRRVGAFARLSPADQSEILREHAAIGRAYGDADLAHDIRLACHGLDTHDNDFVIGLVGRELHPLSHIVQAMRRTAQTSEYIQTLGPFFIGHALWRSRYP